MIYNSKLGTHYIGNNTTTFNIWAPLKKEIKVHLLDTNKISSLKKNNDGFFTGTLNNVHPGTSYKFIIDNKDELPDIYSLSQPEGVHGPSEIIDEAFKWDDFHYKAPFLEDYIIYELHTGTFSKEGTFEGIINNLEYLKNLGITAVEIMPVAQFPGKRNWGYDGVYPFAVQNSYGGLLGLKKLVNECHRVGLAVVLDVVYNHIGPEGNYFEGYAPYFTTKYNTPWGKAINFDGEYSDDVKEYFIQNALFYLFDCHVDALRLDAVHAILDASVEPFLFKLAQRVKEYSITLNKRKYLIAETNMNDKKIVSSPILGGYGLDGLWNDDFHHALHSYLTGEKDGYYMDYGSLAHIEKAVSNGFIYQGDYSPFFKRSQGTASKNLISTNFVIFSQNHDQIGNRMLGERLHQLAGFKKAKLAAALTILSPYIPLLYMGEEFACKNPFLYFIDHSDKKLIEAVRKGRKEEFSHFKWDAEPPDPYDVKTFNKSKINIESHLQKKEHNDMFDFYCSLIDLKKTILPLKHLSKDDTKVFFFESSKILSIERKYKDKVTYLIYNFNEKNIEILLPFNEGTYKKIFDSEPINSQNLSNLNIKEFRANGEFLLSISHLTLLIYYKE
jgi:maltooligosyltrehalose trehalohydrolase